VEKASEKYFCENELITGWRLLTGSPKLQTTKEPPNIGHFCGKWPIKIRDPMSFRHPVLRVYRHSIFAHVCLMQMGGGRGVTCVTATEQQYFVNEFLVACLLMLYIYTWMPNVNKPTKRKKSARPQRGKYFCNPVGSRFFLLICRCWICAHACPIGKKAWPR